MKQKYITVIVLSLLGLTVTSTRLYAESLPEQTLQTQQKKQEITFKFSGNPLVRHLFTADPSARVFGDTLYMYTSHDRDDTDESAHFDMTDWHVFSTQDTENWVDHGAFFSLDDVSWASKQAWAPDAVQRDGKYYFYYPVEQSKIGVAVSESPTSGFKDPLGKPFIDNTNNEQVIGREPIDPAILIDDDGHAYMYFGCRDARVVKLQNNMISLDGEVKKVNIKGIESFTEKSGQGWYGEGPWVFKRNNNYYYVYSNGWEKDTTLVYAMSKSPLGPFEYIGEVMSPVGAGTSHGSITQFKNKWYVFYHSKLLSKSGKQRSVHFDEITFDDNGKIIPLIYKTPKQFTKLDSKKALSANAIQAKTTKANSSGTPLSISPYVQTATWAKPWWLSRHNEKIALKNKMGQVDLVFLGDSITHAFDNKAQATWQKYYAQRKALNLGFAGDRTENVLWRLQHDAVAGINPKLLVLMIGTNNTGHRKDSPEDTALGIKAIIDDLAVRLPKTKVLLLAIFPRGVDANDPLRVINDKTNNLIKHYDDGKQVHYLNINDIFLDEQGVLKKSVMTDLLHPNANQYDKWAEAMAPSIKQLME